MLFGFAGCGKGALTNELIKQESGRAIEVVSSSEVIEAFKAKCQISAAEADKKKNGALLDSGVMKRLVGEKLSTINLGTSMFFEGFPRAPEQLTDLMSILADRDENPIVIAIKYNVPKEVCKWWIEHERAQKEHRPDDLNPEALQKRHKTYEAQMPLIQDRLDHMLGIHQYTLNGMCGPRPQDRRPASDLVSELLSFINQVTAQAHLAVA